MWYLIALGILISLYVFIFFNLKKMRNVKITNCVFASIIFVCYVSLVIYVYFDAGPTDWNFLNTLPTANVSPFMFAIIPIILLLPKKIKKYFLLLVVLLIVGMFLSGIISCSYNAIIGYKFHHHFMLDYIAHFALSLWGIYLIKSGQVELNKKDALVAGSIIIGVSILMLMLNLIFNTAFFGLSLYGKHNIYNVVLTSSSILSVTLYFIGLGFVLILGYFVGYFVNKGKNKEKEI